MVWMAFAANPTTLHAALTPEKLYQKVLPSVMTLEVESQSGEKFIGSAVVALADDVAVTAWHVVADARSVWAVYADGQRVKVIGCVHQDALRDLALLRSEGSPSPILPPELPLSEVTVGAACDGCGLCVRYCPHGSLSLEEGRLVVDPETCSGCGLCAEVCPPAALVVGPASLPV